MQESKTPNRHPKFGEYFDFREVAFYFFRKKDPNRKPSINLRMMHWTNKTSIIMFLVFLVVWLGRRIFDLLN